MNERDLPKRPPKIITLARPPKAPRNDPPETAEGDAIEDLGRQISFMEGLSRSLVPQYVEARHAGKLTDNDVAMALHMLSSVQASLIVYRDYRVELRARRDRLAADLAAAKAQLLREANEATGLTPAGNDDENVK